MKVVNHYWFICRFGIDFDANSATPLAVVSPTKRTTSGVARLE